MTHHGSSGRPAAGPRWASYRRARETDRVERAAPFAAGRKPSIPGSWAATAWLRRLPPPVGSAGRPEILPPRSSSRRLIRRGCRTTRVHSGAYRPPATPARGRRSRCVARANGSSSVQSCRKRAVRPRSITDSQRRLSKEHMVVVRSCRCALAALLFVALSALPSAAQFRGQVFVSGLTHPLAFVQDPSNPNVQFVAQQEGLIRVVQNGALLPAPFLDL